MNSVAYAFHDDKSEGVDEARLRAWFAELRRERVLNRAGTTFPKLPDTDKTGLDRGHAEAIDFYRALGLARREVVTHGRLIEPAEGEAA